MFIFIVVNDIKEENLKKEKKINCKKKNTRQFNNNYKYKP
jgi:hypothetical protein